MEIYSKCTICYKELTKEDKSENATNENFHFPVCNECMEKSIKEIKKILK